jgi:hypothetical protein
LQLLVAELLVVRGQVLDLTFLQFRSITGILFLPLAMVASSDMVRALARKLRGAKNVLSKRCQNLRDNRNKPQYALPVQSFAIW